MPIDSILLTLLFAYVIGLLFCRLKIPGGMLVGGIIGAAILNIAWNTAYIPRIGKIFAQSVAGAFIGSSVKKNELKEMRRILKPAAILLGSYLVMNLGMGLLLYAISPISAPTALFSAVPGGISDIPLIAADMGANAPQVAVLQFVRLVIGIGVFPSMIHYLCREQEQESGESASPPKMNQTNSSTQEPKQWGPFFITIGISLLCGMAGYRTGIPAGTLVFALSGVLLLKIFWGKTFLPLKVKRLAQLLSGAYIGCSIGWADVLELRFLVLPAIIITMGYSAFCLLCGYMLQRFCGMDRKEALLAATPAGASDMVLISMDLGVQSTDLVLLQVLRLIVVSSIFPQVINVVLLLLSS